MSKDKGKIFTCIYCGYSCTYGTKNSKPWISVPTAQGDQVFWIGVDIEKCPKCKSTEFKKKEYEPVDYYDENC